MICLIRYGGGCRFVKPVCTLHSALHACRNLVQLCFKGLICAVLLRQVDHTLLTSRRRLASQSNLPCSSTHSCRLQLTVSGATGIRKNTRNATWLQTATVRVPEERPGSDPCISSQYLANVFTVIHLFSFLFTVGQPFLFL
jgi:hypothetical protein